MNREPQPTQDPGEAKVTANTERALAEIQSMSPLAAVGHWYYLSEASGPFHSNPDDTEYERLRMESGYVDLALEQLPSRNIDHARKIFTIMARSPLKDVREGAAIYLEYVTFTDPDFGFSLWMQLIQDPEGDVRYVAHDSLGGYDDPDLAYAKESITQKGLTLPKVAVLLHLYREANRSDR